MTKLVKKAEQEAKENSKKDIEKVSTHPAEITTRGAT